jgi:GTP cyclohydrolase II
VPEAAAKAEKILGMNSHAALNRLRPAVPHADAADAAGEPRLRAVHRAVAELRRGTPVLLEVAAHDLRLVAAAETVGARGLAVFAGLRAGLPHFLLAQSRAAAVLHRPVAEAVVAFRTAPGLLSPALLRSLADPTAEQLLPAPPEVATGAGDGAAPAAAVQLAKLARVLPAALIAPVQADEAADLAGDGLLRVAAADVMAYPDDVAATLTRVAEARVPLAASENTRIIAFRPADGGIEHLAILVGRPEDLPADVPAPLARLHSECFTGDLLGSLKCDCGPQLQGAIAEMAREGHGVLLYLAQEGRGIGLVNKLRAYALQDRGSDTLDANRQIGFGADERNFAVAAAMLEQLGIGRVRLMTNNPDKLAALAACGIGVEGRVKHVFPTNGHNAKYLATKAERFGHLIG